MSIPATILIMALSRQPPRKEPTIPSRKPGIYRLSAQNKDGAWLEPAVLVVLKHESWSPKNPKLLRKRRANGHNNSRRRIRKTQAAVDLRQTVQEAVSEFNKSTPKK